MGENLKITDNFTEAEIAKLRRNFVENEANTDEYRETQPHKTFWYLNRLDEYHTNGVHHLRIMEALNKWASAYVADFKANPNDSYPGADNWGDLGNVIFDLHITELGEHPYYTTLEEIRIDLDD
jgi:hypothetical protein